MGKRSRSGGLTGAVLKTARAAQSARDKEAAAMSQAIYVMATEWKANQGSMYMAPVAFTSQQVAQAVCEAAEIPVTEQNVLDVATYLVVKYRELLTNVDPEEVAAVAATYRSSGLL